MPILSRPDAELYFEEIGEGFPVLLLAPGIMQSCMWNWMPEQDGITGPYVHWGQALGADFRVVAMDQRNAGESTGAIAADHGWHTFAEDQIALMDQLGCDRFHLIGAEAGCSSALKLMEMVPERVAAAVLQNHIGHLDESPTYFRDMFAEWADKLTKDRSDLDRADIDAFGENMWGGDFLFSVTPGALATMKMPVVNMPGDDDVHPFDIGNGVDGLLPNSLCLPEWKSPLNEGMQRAMVMTQLKQHASG